MKKQNFTSKTYRLTRGQRPLSYTIPSRNTSRSPLLYFDEESGINRPLRYARNQKSPFEDEQDGNAILDHVIFEEVIQILDQKNYKIIKCNENIVAINKEIKVDL